MVFIAFGVVYNGRGGTLRKVSFSLWVLDKFAADLTRKKTALDNFIGVSHR